MRLLPLLARVLLSVCVVLYGVSAAPAHAHGTKAVQESGETDAPVVESDLPLTDCHDAGKVPVPADMQHAQDAQADCCQSPGCTCHCSHQAPAVVVLVAFSPASLHAPAPPMPATGYTPPSGVGLNRPPIG